MLDEQKKILQKYWDNKELEALLINFMLKGKFNIIQEIVNVNNDIQMQKKIYCEKFDNFPSEDEIPKILKLEKILKQIKMQIMEHPAKNSSVTRFFIKLESDKFKNINDILLSIYTRNVHEEIRKLLFNYIKEKENLIIEYPEFLNKYSKIRDRIIEKNINN